MMSLQYLASLVIRIKELQERIQFSPGQGSTYPEQLELAELRSKLARMKEESEV